MKSKKLLLLSTTAGAGHVRAADALKRTAETLFSSVEVEHRDILDFTTPLFRKIYSQVNNTIAGHAPELWGFIYKKSESQGIIKPKHPLLKLFDQFNFKKYLQYLNEWKPSAVLCTHFLPYVSISEEMQKKSWKIPYHVVPTDYDVHSLWISPLIKQYYVATEEAAWTVQSHGISEEKISVTGIPVAPEFTHIGNRNSIRKELRVERDRFTILILSGGYGIGVIDKLVPNIIEFLSSLKQRKFQVLVVCGKNKKLFDTLSTLEIPRNINFKLYEYVTFIDKLMDVSDILITKSGGLTVSEALSKHLPMLIFDPVPGQEGRNADYLCETGVAQRVSSFINMRYKLNRLIEEPVSLSAMKNNAKNIAKPEATKTIISDILKRIDEKYLKSDMENYEGQIQQIREK
ncbi:MAG: glycosyltransferase [Ignavibacteriae bacterium]|nr:glycosyltransferase [Ignavibacteriota bacterium]